MSIEYKINAEVSVDQFIDVLKHCSLGVRRPIDDRVCMEGMVTNSNLCISAWDGDELVGIARAMTDFHYACYLADLAIKDSHQRQGIGKKLQKLTQAQLGPRCNLILLAAPSANNYYEPLGYESNPRGWILERNVTLK
jgi:ribosomal protein S18 acetylase RimI-like enzyme